MTQDGKSAKPAYVSFRTFLNFLEWLEEAGVPSRLDRTFWGERLSGATGIQLMGALRFLGLIDGSNRPQQKLQDMARNPDKRRAILREHLLRCYARAVQNLDLERASLGELQEQFRIYSIEGETLRKALAFFIHAAEYSGMQLSSYITKKTRTTKKINGARKRIRHTKRQLSRDELPQDKLTPNPAQEYNLHPSLQGLLTDLIQIGSNWTQEQQDRWLKTWIENIRYAHPAKPFKEFQIDMKLPQDK